MMWNLAAGTLNSDQPRDLDLPLKDRFFLQPAAKRAKESAKDIINVKALIDKKAWPYVPNDLHLRAEYLRYDLNTVISTKPKEEKKALQGSLVAAYVCVSKIQFKTFKLKNNVLISNFSLTVGPCSKSKSTPQAEKYYAETVSTLNDVLAKLG
ncbi:hypothetical protein L6164_006883 [Bauhinia variegata]|uniref:Uncharacterized protein n=1 Tax=Bauhinia variegata TaxID=167791 RepID=A0ACB9PXX4_BAUVA|nr:hypothetical protein L6164_006883 [Bauhinia variegata]